MMFSLTNTLINSINRFGLNGNNPLPSQQPDSTWVFTVGGTSYTGRGGEIAGDARVSWKFGSGIEKTTMFEYKVTTEPNENLTFWISDSSKLISFDCSGNQLTGSIPSLTTNTALDGFGCSYNQLTGSIPSLTTNTALTGFDCSDNQLTGSIPSLTTNTALTGFDCSDNQLTGFGGGSVSNTLIGFYALNNLLTESAVNSILDVFVVANGNDGALVLNGTGNAAPTGQGLIDKATLQSRGWTVTTN